VIELAPTGQLRRMPRMRVGIIDVGSNTVRLLVATPAERGVDAVFGERAYAGLAAEIERTGAISSEKLSEVGRLAAHYSSLAFEHGADKLEVIVTAPGRHSANASELHDVLASATKAAVRQLSAEEEGRLAYAGAVGACSSVPDTIAVVDVGGGSTQLMVGTESEPAWLRGLDLGSLRLTERFVRNDPPTRDELAGISRAVEDAIAELTPPLPLSALATGGTARTLRRLVGRRLREMNLTAALEIFTANTASLVADGYGIPLERVRVLAAGTIVLRAAHRRFNIALQVAKGGVREGAVLGLIADLAEEAA
jgi:exopolyphosphatase / guanosine-5'-triphosphate,3'-diphosphate pyrophosphatase